MWLLLACQPELVWQYGEGRMYWGPLGFLAGSRNQVKVKSSELPYFSHAVTAGMVVIASKLLQNNSDFVGLAFDEDLCFIPCRPVRLHIVLH